MKRLLIFHATIPSYRIDLFNKLTDFFCVKLIAYGKKENVSKLGFDYKQVAQEARFEYKVYDRGIYFGNNHLLSTMYYHEIKKFKPDIVFCQELGVNTLAAIALKKLFGYKIFINCDDSPDMLLHYSKKREWLRKYVFNRIDGVLVVHTEVERKLKVIFPQCRFLYFPIIQDENRFQEKLDASKDFADNYRNKFGLDHQTIFLFVGRLVEEKQPMMLLEAFKKADIPLSKLILVGSGPLSDPIKNYVQDNQLENRVLLTGKLQGNELYAWYRIADYFVLPSKFEPFGAVVNEALMSGCKVIVSDKVGANTLVSVHNGVIFNSTNRNELIDILKSSLQKKKSIENLTPISFKDLILKLNSFFYNDN